MSDKMKDLLARKASEEAASAILKAAESKAVAIPLGDTPPPPVIGDFILVKDVDPSGNVYPALVLSVGEGGAMVLEVHAVMIQARQKLPNGQTITTGVPIPHTFIISTDDTGNLPAPAKWFHRS